MKPYTLPIIFALCTAICWGLYGPTVANARSTAKPPAWSPFKPYVFIGVAYLVLACGGGLLGMTLKGDSYAYGGAHSAAAKWGFAAGALGALGALGLTTAMLSFPAGMKPKAELVMPIVFGGAVTVNAIAALFITRSAASASPLLWIGMAIVAVGIILVAANTPHGPPGVHKPKTGEHAKAPAAMASSNEPNPAG